MGQWSSMTDSATIETLADRINERLVALGLSERQASILATGQPDALRYIRTRKAMPSTERLFKIAKVLKVDPSYLWGSTDENDWEGVKDALDVATSMAPDALKDLSFVDEEDNTTPCLKSARGSLRVFPTLDASGNVSVELAKTTADIVHLLLVPPSLTNRRVVGYQVVGEAMAPLYNNDDFILIEADRHPAVKEVALVDLGPSDGGRDSFLAIVLGRTKYAVSFRQLSTDTAFQVPTRAIRDLHRVVPYGDLITI